ncbi:MAG: amidohydrolase family protein [Planctomycetes bacterium]|nr:amidohydrolase family protein [Planctomycetota bacterium]
MSPSSAASRRSAPHLILARAFLPRADRWIERGALVVHAGRIQAVLAGARRVARHAERALERIDLGEVVVTPGLVNAHAHLELPALGAAPGGPEDFQAWIGRVLAARAAVGPDDYTRAWERAAARALATGTTLVADVDSTGAWCRGASERASRRAPRVRVLREFLDAFDGRRTPGALARLEEPIPKRARTLHGYSPHAPHTVSDALLDAIARRTRAQHGWIGVHWAETPEEREWLEHGRGPFAARLGRSPQVAGLERLAARGLLGPRTTLFHGNDARPHELDRIARAGATLVHCPGTHAWFAREPVDLHAWEHRGVRLALGTDSLASNTDLDLALELARLRAAHPRVAPERAWDWATRGGASALGCAGRAGELRPGAWADLAAWRIERWTRAEALDALTLRSAALDSVWLAGARAEGAALPAHGSEW